MKNHRSFPQSELEVLTVDTGVQEKIILLSEASLSILSSTSSDPKLGC